MMWKFMLYWRLAPPREEPTEKRRCILDHVYMTQCSLIRTYHQLENARSATVVSASTPSLIDWLVDLAGKLSRRSAG